MSLERVRARVRIDSDRPKSMMLVRVRARLQFDRVAADGRSSKPMTPVHACAMHCRKCEKRSCGGQAVRIVLASKMDDARIAEIDAKLDGWVQILRYREQLNARQQEWETYLAEQLSLCHGFTVTPDTTWGDIIDQAEEKGLEGDALNYPMEDSQPEYAAAWRAVSAQAKLVENRKEREVFYAAIESAAKKLSDTKQRRLISLMGDELAWLEPPFTTEFYEAHEALQEYLPKKGTIPTSGERFHSLEVQIGMLRYRLGLLDLYRERVGLKPLDRNREEATFKNLSEAFKHPDVKTMRAGKRIPEKTSFGLSPQAEVILSVALGMRDELRWLHDQITEGRKLWRKQFGHGKPGSFIRPTISELLSAD